MTNQIESALKSAIEDIENLIKVKGRHNTEIATNRLFDNLPKLKSALEALAKCESETSSQPVGYVWDKDKKYCYVIDTDIQFKHGTKLYDKPQPRDWVELSASDIREAWNKAEGTYFNTFAIAISAKLKQLNTKG